MTSSFMKELQRVHAAPEAAKTHARCCEPERLLSLRDSLFAQAASMTEMGMRLHLLVDPVLADPLEDSPWRKRAVDVPVTTRADAPVRMPYLLPLGDIGRDDAIDFSLDIGFAEATRHVARETRGSTMCAWLACPLGEETRIARLLADLARRRGASQREKFLRLWDPRVFELLMPLLSAPALRELAGGASGWWWIDRGGKLASRPANDGDAGWTSPGTLDVLAAAGRINGVLNALQDADVAFDRLPSTSAILALIARAQTQWGLADDFDVVRFSLYGVLVHPAFDSDSDVRAAMDAARARGDSCMDALTSFDESHWEQTRNA